MIDERLLEHQKNRDCNWQRLIFILRKHFDIWAHQNLTQYWGDVKISYMPVIFNINLEGSTSIDIARKSMIAKQSISRTIKELEGKGFIVTKPMKHDKRSELLELSQEGKQFVLDASDAAARLQENYKQLVGAEKLAIAEEVINKIIAYHEQLEEEQGGYEPE
jgi:DNA-binding MarR family transcriptional regulator